MKRFLCAVMAIVMVFTIAPLTVFVQAGADSKTTANNTLKSLSSQLQDTANDPFNYQAAPRKTAQEYPAQFDLRSVDTNGDGVAAIQMALFLMKNKE